MKSWLLFCLVCWACPGARSLRAQVLRGVVVHADGVTPAPQTLIELASDGGGEPRRTLTGSGGVFRIPLPAGRHVLRALRIGYQPTVVDPLLMPGRDTAIRLVLTDTRVVLERIEVITRDGCRELRRASPAIAAVWEEARKALLSTSLADLADRVARVVTYDRTLSEAGVVLRQQSTKVTTTHPRAAEAISLDSLERFGYVWQGAGAAQFFGPDADVLLSESFLRTHCLSAAPVPGDTSLVALRFEPARAPRLTDIRGVLQLEREGGHLRAIEFEYVNLPHALPRIAGSGGTLQFGRTRDHVWFIARWTLRLPVTGNSGANRAGDTAATLQEVGAVVSSIVADGDTVFRGALPSLTGLVRYARDSVPAASARVFLSGTTTSTLSDSTGAFALTELIPGLYKAGAVAQQLEGMGALRPPMRVDLRQRSLEDVALYTDRPSEVVTKVCEDFRWRSPVGLVWGRVVDNAGAPVAGARVAIEVAETEAPGPFDGRARREVRSEHDGTFSLCGVPRGWSYRVRVEQGAHIGAWQSGVVAAPHFLSRVVLVAGQPGERKSPNGW